jgi:putative endonuclease
MRYRLSTLRIWPNQFGSQPIHEWSIPDKPGRINSVENAFPIASPEAALKVWFVYILRCADDTLYTGVSTDVVRRVEEHNAGAPLGARYTRSRRPVQLLFQETAESRSAALRRELEIKSKSRAAKWALIEGSAE